MSQHNENIKEFRIKVRFHRNNAFWIYSWLICSIKVSNAIKRVAAITSSELIAKVGITCTGNWLE